MRQRRHDPSFLRGRLKRHQAVCQSQRGIRAKQRQSPWQESFACSRTVCACWLGWGTAARAEVFKVQALQQLAFYELKLQPHTPSDRSPETERVTVCCRVQMVDQVRGENRSCFKVIGQL